MPQLGAADATGKIRRIRPIFIITTEYFNPRSPCGERRPRARTPRARTLHFNPRSPHGERQEFARTLGALVRFQPTLPARGATDISDSDALEGVFQPTLPARGATGDFLAFTRRQTRFQPTLPARGATAGSRKQASRRTAFQPTLPARGATRRFTSSQRTRRISTHAPRTGSDMLPIDRVKPYARFQPTLPARGATLSLSENNVDSFKFQPTLPARGATSAILHSCHRGQNFNPRSPHGERLFVLRRDYIGIKNFNPRSPHGERRLSNGLTQQQLAISTHAPRTGSDVQYLRCHCKGFSISTHAPRTGSDKDMFDDEGKPTWHFNPRSPHGERPR